MYLYYAYNSALHTFMPIAIAADGPLKYAVHG